MTVARIHADWLEAFVSYAQIGEAPVKMYFWAGVSAIAGALQRRVWIDQEIFRWFPNFYIVLVAPPGIVSKSTTASISMNLLRQVEGVKFGPDVVTWPALVTAFAEATSAFPFEGDYYPQSALTLESSEFGNLLNPNDPQMVDLLVSLWDGKQGVFDKRTKSSGNDTVENPWINLIACTTPSWIAGNFPEYMIGGGFTSRCVFVYAEKKAKFVAYPGRHVVAATEGLKRTLIRDLQDIATITGPMVIAEDAMDWGDEWYERHYRAKHLHLDDARFGGYIARKQTHIHKLAMVLSAAKGNDRKITKEMLMFADARVTELERDMPLVFRNIGLTPDAQGANRIVALLSRYESMPYAELYKAVHALFPNAQAFEQVFKGLLGSGQIKVTQKGNDFIVYPVADKIPPASA